MARRGVYNCKIKTKAPLKTHGESLQSFAVHLTLGTACQVNEHYFNRVQCIAI